MYSGHGWSSLMNDQVRQNVFFFHAPAGSFFCADLTAPRAPLSPEKEFWCSLMAKKKGREHGNQAAKKNVFFISY